MPRVKRGVQAHARHKKVLSLPGSTPDCIIVYRREKTAFVFSRFRLCIAFSLKPEANLEPPCHLMN